MIRILDKRYFNGTSQIVNIAGNSGDAKPTYGIVTGSKFVEVDTGIEYMFDEVSGAWVAQNTGNGKTSVANATVTLGSALTYNGSEQTKSVSSVKIGSTTLTVSTDYEIVGNTGKDAGTYTMRIKGVGSYCGYIDEQWTIGKASGSVTASPDELSLEEGGDDGTSTLTVVGDGAVSVSSSDEDVATVSVDDGTVTVSPVGAGTATVTVTLADSENYNGGTDTISVTVAAAEDPAET